MAVGIAIQAGMGTDFDGVSKLPHGIESLSDMCSLAAVLKDRYGEAITNKILYENAFTFFKTQL